MVRNEKAKTAALVLTAVILALSLLCHDVVHLGVAVRGHASLHARLAYSFFHASVIHALANGWCLLSIVFVYDVSLAGLVTAYAIAVAFPVDTLGAAFPAAAAPTVGMSAMCFALLGMVFFQVRRKLYFTLWILSFFATGYVLPLICSFLGCHVAAPNNVIHVYSYMAGLFVGFLDTPASWIKK